MFNPAFVLAAIIYRFFVWNRLGHRLSEMQFELLDGKVWQLNLELLPLQSSEKNGDKK